MRPLAGGLPIAAGETVNLAPGGNHVMLEQLTRPLKAGEKIPLTLNFERSGARQVEAQVSDDPPHDGADTHRGH
jgi:periplasmic copper chaperone A